jgi:hypothetical protein
MYCSPRCSDKKEVVLPERETYVMVEQAQQPLISITGQTTFPTSADDLRLGQKVGVRGGCMGV